MAQFTTLNRYPAKLRAARVAWAISANVETGEALRAAARAAFSAGEIDHATLIANLDRVYYVLGPAAGHNPNTGIAYND